VDTERLTRAISLARAGQKEAAREILEALVRAEPTNEIAWLWLADTQPDDLRRVRVLREAQRHLPRSLNINKALALVNARLTSGAAPASTSSSQKPSPAQVEHAPQPSPPQPTAERSQPVAPRATQADEEASQVVEALRRQSQVRRLWPLWVGLVVVVLAGLVVGAWALPGSPLRPWLSGFLSGSAPSPTVPVVAESESPLITAEVTEEALATEEVTPVEETPPVEEATFTEEEPTPTSLETPTPAATPTPAPLWIDLDGTPIRAMAWAPRARLIALATNTGVLFYNADDLTRRGYVENPIDNPRLVLSDDGRWLIANGVVTRLWQVEDSQAVRTLSTDPVTALALSADNTYVALAETRNKGQVRVLWVQNDQNPSMTLPNGSAVFDLAFSPDGSRLATALEDGRTLVWNLGSGTVLFSRIPETGRTLRLAFSPRGDLLAAGNEDGGVWLWDGQGNEVRVLRGPVGMIFALAFTSDGTRLAASGEDPAIYVWSVSDGQVQARLEGHTAPVTGLRFAPQGDRLLSASEDGTVRFWSLQATATP